MQLFNEAEVIHRYTRAQAIADGVLVDVSETGREAGVRFPVALTCAVYSGYVKPDPRAVPFGQSIEGRLWDTLYMFSIAARRFSGDTLTFRLYYIMGARQRRLVELKAVIGPGDTGEPVITIMLPNED